MYCLVVPTAVLLQISKAGTVYTMGCSSHAGRMTPGILSQQRDNNNRHVGCRTVKNIIGCYNLI
jgi:hypothetical protein